MDSDQAMITAWILAYLLSTGDVAVYAVYTNQAQCTAVASTLRHNVRTGVVECIKVVYD